MKTAKLDLEVAAALRDRLSEYIVASHAVDLARAPSERERSSRKLDKIAESTRQELIDAVVQLVGREVLVNQILGWLDEAPEAEQHDLFGGES